MMMIMFFWQFVILSMLTISYLQGIEVEITTEQTLEMNNNIMKELETNFFQGAGILASQLFQNQLQFNRDSKKEIEIHCPGPDPPQVTVKELGKATEEDEEEEIVHLDGEDAGEEEKNSDEPRQCLSIKLTGTNFDMQMKVIC